MKNVRLVVFFNINNKLMIFDLTEDSKIDLGVRSKVISLLWSTIHPIVRLEVRDNLKNVIV
jgi:hypothetical protein